MEGKARKNPARKSKSFNPYNLIKKYQYQLDWVNDKSRFKVWIKSRQIGGSYAGAFEIVEDIISSVDGFDWYVLSVSEKVAGEFLEKIVSIAKVFQASMKAEYSVEPFSFTHTADTVKFTLSYGEKKVVCLPANKRTATGFSGNLFCDEVAKWEQGRDLYNSAFPIVTNVIRGPYKLRLVSTPFGQLDHNGNDNIFYEIYSGDNEYKKFTTTVHDAKRQGYGIDIDQLRKQFPDPYFFAQEFECVCHAADGGLGIIPEKDVMRAIETPPVQTSKLMTAFCDIAAGGDECVFAPCQGNHVLPLHGWRNKDFDHNIGMFIELFNSYRNGYGLMPENIWVDAGGLGVNYVSRLTNMGYNINSCNNQSPAGNQSKYENVGAEMYFHVAERLRKGQIKFPQGDSLLVNQLCARKAVYSSRGLLKLEEKSKMKKSPDRADAAVGACYFFDQLNLTNDYSRTIKTDYAHTDTEDDTSYESFLSDMGVR